MGPRSNLPGVTSGIGAGFSRPFRPLGRSASCDPVFSRPVGPDVRAQAARASPPWDRWRLADRGLRLRVFLRSDSRSILREEPQKRTARGIAPEGRTRGNYFPAATYSPTHWARAVPSALRGLTAVFGMGTGVSPPPWPPKPVRFRKDLSGPRELHSEHEQTSF